MRRFAGWRLLARTGRWTILTAQSLGEFGHVFVLVTLQGKIMGVVFFGFRPLFIADA
jgi:hypothetical protein